MINRFKINVISVVVVYLLLVPVVFATGVLDWSAEGYTAGSFNESYTNIGTPGVDIDVVTTGSTNDLNDSGFNSPLINNGALLYFPNYENENETVTITISFSQAVSNLSFLIRDIDEGNYEDQITITGTGPTGNVLPVIRPDNEAPITYTVAGNVATANGLGAGFNDETPVTFNDAVTQVVIVYGNGPGFTGNPGGQLIWLDDLSFESPPSITKQFTPNTILTGQTSSLVIGLENDGLNTATLTSDLVDNLPTGVSVANPANISGTCPGTTNAVVGSNTVTYTNGSTIPVGGCTISVDVTSSTVGTVTNTIAVGALQTDIGSNIVAASDDITVNAPNAPTVNKTFTPNSIGVNGTSTLTITLGNTNPIPLTLTSALTDILPTAGNGDVVVAATPNISGTCASANVIALAGAPTVIYANGATIPVGGCTINVDVTSATTGIHTNTIAVGALQTNFGNNNSAASATLTVTATNPPTVTKSFNPASISSGATSQLTIALGNSNTSAITLSANLDDNLPTGVSATSVDTVATTCTDASVDITTNTRVRYTNGSSIPTSGCNIVVNVTSNTLGSVTNTIAAGALQTNVGNNTTSASDDLTITAGGGGGPATCPAGTTLVNLGTPRNATTATSTGNVTGTIANGTGPILAIGTNVAGSAEPRMTNVPATVTLGLTDIVPLNGTITLSLAQDNSAGVVDIQDSTDNVVYGAATSFTGSNPTDDIIEHLNYTVQSSGGGQFFRFTLTAGRFRIDGAEYSQICELPPSADLIITKDDGSLTYTPGGTATYTIIVTNNGPDDVTGATIADNLPNGVTMTAPWTCTPSSGSSSCNTAPNTVDPISIDVDIVNGDSITVTVPVQFSSDMNDY